ncbi:gas vesicle protein GvpM [Natronobacterium texcoconense]|uniref:Gas vesicle protein n=1 Tax=Natronobacterium texcoconense TaxID=1095778 RepID=A0A1H1G8I3_NATTX|nr:gas vesicle protein GvpJ [Natronobacterium texcoconense]SDR09395.1 Gas vesicle protein [Natronobacterium texcoconense]
MRPRKDDEAFVDVIDVLLRDGAILRADVIVSVADVPLVGIKLTAAIAGMETMTEYGMFQRWDARRRQAALAASSDVDSSERVTIPNANGRDEQETEE